MYCCSTDCIYNENHSCTYTLGIIKSVDYCSGYTLRNSESESIDKGTKNNLDTLICAYTLKGLNCTEDTTKLKVPKEVVEEVIAENVK